MRHGTPDALRRAAWQHLSRGVADRKHPARHPTLATIGADGPAARTVVLRGWEGGVAEIHTDAASAKVAELQADPRAALHVWVPRSKLQIRLACHVSVVLGDADRWAAVPEGARRNYGGTPAPGALLGDPTEHDVTPVPERFAVLRCRVTGGDVLHLGEDRHRRVAFASGENGWVSRWVAP